MPPSPSPSPLWPATLHHLALLSPDADRLAGCLGAALQMRCERSEDGCSVLTGPDRRITIQPGAASGALHLGYALDDVERVAGLQSRFARRGIRTESSGVPFFRTGSFRVAAPDGVALVFGVPAAHAQTTDLEGLSGRLQHAVFRTPEPEPLLSFLMDEAGFVLSDRVVDDDGNLTAGFVRSDPEHHSFAAFRASRPGFDHFALETSGWNDLRDWGDHFADLRMPIWWGPGRHGPGNNLFLMVRDPDGNRIEISAEMEHMDPDAPHRVWPQEERTLNLWGNAWMRT